MASGYRELHSCIIRGRPSNFPGAAGSMLRAVTRQTFGPRPSPPQREQRCSPINAAPSTVSKERSCARRSQIRGDCGGDPREGDERGRSISHGSIRPRRNRSRARSDNATRGTAARRYSSWTFFASWAKGACTDVTNPRTTDCSRRKEGDTETRAETEREIPRRKIRR